MASFLLIVSTLAILLPHLVSAITEIGAGNWVAGLSDAGIFIGGVAGLFHLHIKFNFFGLSVDSDAPVK